MKRNKLLIYSIVILVLILAGFFVLKQSLKSQDKLRHETGHEPQAPKSESRILYYIDGKDPSVKVSVEEYKSGKAKDPMYGMDLVPVFDTKEEEERVVSLTEREVSLAGIKTFKVKELSLFKEIRTVGRVAYDPDLRAAEEEYIQALESYIKISKYDFKEAKQRSKEILEASRLKLEVLGLTDDWVKELQVKRKPHKSLILPDEYMWVYADIYEFESNWPKITDKVEITSQVNSSIIFHGEIRAIEPVVEEKTRTFQLNILTKNEDFILKPNMYVDVVIKSDMGKALSIPKTAVLDTGKRKVAFVDLKDGRYQLRNVRVGPAAVNITDGVKKEFYPLEEGIYKNEYVVVKGNYLLDSQSELGAAGAIYGGALEGEEKKVPAHQH
jgi:Cu(I)/Ag(I) efflux system membrane fusion protein